MQVTTGSSGSGDSSQTADADETRTSSTTSLSADGALGYGQDRPAHGTPTSSTTSTSTDGTFGYGQCRPARSAGSGESSHAPTLVNQKPEAVTFEHGLESISGRLAFAPKSCDNLLEEHFLVCDDMLGRVGAQRDALQRDDFQRDAVQRDALPRNDFKDDSQLAITQPDNTCMVLEEQSHFGARGLLPRCVCCFRRRGGHRCRHCGMSPLCRTCLDPERHRCRRFFDSAASVDADPPLQRGTVPADPEAQPGSQLFLTVANFKLSTLMTVAKGLVAADAVTLHHGQGLANGDAVTGHSRNLNVHLHRLRIHHILRTRRMSIVQTTVFVL